MTTLAQADEQRRNRALWNWLFKGVMLLSMLVAFGTLGILLAVTLVLGGLALLGVIPVWAPAPIALLLGAFIVHLRSESRAQVALDRRRQAARRVLDQGYDLGKDGLQPRIIGDRVGIETLVPKLAR